jgi:hypothetical protein
VARADRRAAARSAALAAAGVGGLDVAGDAAPHVELPAGGGAQAEAVAGGALPLAAVAAEVAERVAPAVALMAGNHEARAASARASAWR